MDDFELEIKKEFLNESLINLEEVEESFMELESASDKKPLLDKIFRLAHNLKGGSRAVGFGEVAEFTHVLESLVLKIQKGEVALTTHVITTLLRSNDRIVEMLSELKGNLSATFSNGDILAELQACLDGTAGGEVVAAPTPEPMMVAATEEPAPQPEEPTAVAAEEPTAANEVPSAADFFADEPAVEVASAPEPVQPIAPVTPLPPPPPQMASANKPAKETNAKEGAGKEDEVIRVNLSRINLLNDYVGELIVLQSVVQQQTMLGNRAKLQMSVRQMAKLSKDIQSLTMSLRMLPVKPLVQKLQRVVRDTAQVLKKEVAFHVQGDQMEIDKSVMDQLGDPLIHILRNAVDHGLELPDDRTQAGKTSQGKVTLAFMNEGNHLVIEIRDDGKGINTAILHKKAIERGILTESESMTEKQLINLIFHPGFSTKSETSEISGRGVGMDVVKTNIEKIGGLVDVTTTLGAGSVFRLQIPLSLAVVDGLVVTSDANRYVIPISQIQETVNLKSQKVFCDQPGVGWCFELRGAVVPLFFLEEALGDKKAKGKPDGTALIVTVDDRPIALGVHDILRAQQIVIKPFANGITPQRGWVGTCVLGDGLPTLILSPIDLLSGRITHSLKEVNA